MTAEKNKNLKPCQQVYVLNANLPPTDNADTLMLMLTLGTFV